MLNSRAFHPYITTRSSFATFDSTRLLVAIALPQSHPPFLLTSTSVADRGLQQVRNKLKFRPSLASDELDQLIPGDAAH